MTELRFHKMHGLGNCFVLVDDTGGDIADGADLQALARSVCDRNRGLGADGLILVQRADGADLAMRIVNNDGSEAEMCGNGIRCFARFVVDEGISDRRELAVMTGAGIIRTRLLDDGRVEVDMGPPGLRGDDVIAPAGDGPVRLPIGGREFTFVSMGNPHAVTFVDELGFDWRAAGAAVEVAEPFPNRVNAHFARIDGPGAATVKVWERGCGETQACGTGACAVAVAGALEGRLPRELVTIELPGGPLDIHWRESDHHVTMTGPAVDICRGVFYVDAG